MQKYLWVCACICTLFVNAQECEYTLQGTIVDFHDNSPLVGATLIVAGLEKAVLSDFDGNYTIKGLCDGSYTLQVSHPECDTKAVPVTVSGNTTLDIKLEHHLEELGEVTIKGAVFKKNVLSAQEQVLDSEILDAKTSGSLGDALKSISGVSTLNTGNTVAKPVIQGLHSSRVLIYNNGTKMEDQEWGAEHAPNVDLNAAGKVAVIKGANALQYGGGAVGGIVIVEPEKAPLKDTIYGKTIVTGSTNGRGGTLTSNLTKAFKSGWYTRVQGTYKRFGDFETPDYILSNTGQDEKDFSLGFGLNKFSWGFDAYYSYFDNEVGILRASHLGGAEDQVRAINSDRPFIIDDFTYNIIAPRQDVNHHLAKLKLFKRFENFGKISAQYDFQLNNRLEYDVRRDSEDNRPSVDLELATHHFNADLVYDAKIDYEIKTGFSFGYQDNFADPSTGVRRLIPDYERYDLGAYAALTYNLSPTLTVESGLRYDFQNIDAFKFYRLSRWEERGYDETYPEFEIDRNENQILTNPNFDYHNVSATAGFSLALNNTYKLLGNYSLASRSPNPSELFSEGLHHSASRIEIGDLSFNSERANKFSVTLEHDTKHISFSVSPFANFISDFILIEPTGIEQTIRGNFQVWEYRQTQARLLGVDVDARLQLTKNFSTNHQLSIVKGRDTSLDRALINMPPVNTTNSLTFKNEKLNNLRLGITSQYVFRQNEFPNNNFEVFIPETETTEVVDLSTPPDAYHLLGFTSSVDFSVFNKSTLNVGLDVSNIFNTEYRDYLNRLRYYADDLGRNVTLRLKLNY
ncbi:TonB-dependent receptor [Croceibacter atlanticus]|uniref:TonB-dependent receptor n=1 Tax=Croceibacter atlanticus TaxID=313588 RepID=UPI001C5F6D84|nr:TonB-dependent receptor [Croceibacter atlanticus]MBW4969065.1 TonB-dependent receptor [Croceibacter atlanticus]